MLLIVGEDGWQNIGFEPAFECGDTEPLKIIGDILFPPHSISIRWSFYRKTRDCNAQACF